MNNNSGNPSFSSAPAFQSQSNHHSGASTAPQSGTVIGRNIIIEGEISGDEPLWVQGAIKGKVQLKENLFVETGAQVDADIQTHNLEIAGQVTGNMMIGDKVELKKDCRVVGNIRSPRILIADGASFKGNIDMG